MLDLPLLSDFYDGASESLSARDSVPHNGTQGLYEDDSKERPIRTDLDTVHHMGDQISRGQNLLPHQRAKQWKGHTIWYKFDKTPQDTRP